MATVQENVPDGVDFSLYAPALHGRHDASAIGELDASRILDIVVSVALLLITAPLLILIAILVFFADPGPILFAHYRLGRGGREFPCLKFRTMVVDADVRLARLLEEDPAARRDWDRDQKLRNDPRITSVGNILRQLSFDELPQLLNVLRGEMSLVGPRPIVRAEIRRYGRYYAHYCKVKPGITGLWQVSGRNHVSYRRRVALDVRYAKSRTIGLNLWILARTVPCVLRGSGY
jgi:lipopolysaccharide/colanic/teichoic acid biosynthesis glycosyltransferase